MAEQIQFNPPKPLLDDLTILYREGNFKTLVYRASELSLRFPKSLVLFTMLGAAHSKLRQFDKAEFNYRKALQINPNFVEAYNNLGIIFKEKGNLYAALESYKKAISLRSNYDKAYINLGKLLENLIFLKPDRELHKTLEKLIESHDYVLPIKVSKSIISLLKHEETFLDIFSKLNKKSISDDLLLLIDHLTQYSLLLKLMKICPISDTDFEQVFRIVRSQILLQLDDLKPTKALLKFLTSLSLQCFTNEFIYYETEDEKRLVLKLEKELTTDYDQGKSLSIAKVLCLASYRNLNQHCWAKNFVYERKFIEVKKRFIDEPSVEEKLALNIPTFGKITNEISLKVKMQYEENPYPRWQQTVVSEPQSLSEIFNQIPLRLNSKKIFDTQSPKVLIAGCGTGHQSIQTAMRFRNSEILAVDISSASLAYAIRKTEEYGIKNISYLQADLLDLQKMGKKFDIVECSGVLHHLENPFSGWKTLLGCLKSSGLMRVGLYSKLARKEIIKTRNIISESQIRPTKDQIRVFRKKMIDLNKYSYKQLSKWDDFYSMSEFRDLIFHVQEHSFTIEKIKEMLDELKMVFCGFETEKVLKSFKKKNRQISDLYDLDKWDEFECENPKSFSSMYQFWCQKATFKI